MLTEITPNSIFAAHELNVRDAKMADAVENGTTEEDARKAFPDDDTVFIENEVAEQPVRSGGSRVSVGPYPRNRRVLADIALCANFTTERAQEFERRVLSEHADWYTHHKPLQLDNTGGLTHVKDGKPFTFDHISWSMLTHLIDRTIKDMAPDKQAVVRAGVLNMYEGNSKGTKKLPPRGTKRKSVDKPEEDEVSAEQEKIDNQERYLAALHGELRDNWETPQDVKNKLKTLVQSGDMSQETVCAALGVTNSEYQAFLSTRKKKEQYESKTYHTGREFFIEREKQGVHVNKKQRKDSAQKSSPAGESKNSDAASLATAKDDESSSDLSTIHLDGEETETVPIYDTCNEIRRKITQHIKNTKGLTKVQFVKDVTSTSLHFSDSIDTRKLGRFEKLSGPNAGATTPVFYAAYVYFEKLRIKEGKDKSKMRKDMEEVWGAKGMARDTDHNQRMTCVTGEYPKVNKFGQIEIVGGDGSWHGKAMTRKKVRKSR